MHKKFTISLVKSSKQYLYHRKEKKKLIPECTVETARVGTLAEFK